jgi:hypothetical protein
MDVSGWTFVVVAGPLLLGAILAFVISSNRRRAPDLRLLGCEADEQGSGSKR